MAITLPVLIQSGGVTGGEPRSRPREEAPGWAACNIRPLDRMRRGGMRSPAHGDRSRMLKERGVSRRDPHVEASAP